MPSVVSVKVLRPIARAPFCATPGASEYDITCVDEFTVPSRDRILVGTGIALSFPEHLCTRVLPRSGLAKEKGINVSARRH